MIIQVERRRIYPQRSAQASTRNIENLTEPAKEM